MPLKDLPRSGAPAHADDEPWPGAIASPRADEAVPPSVRLPPGMDAVVYDTETTGLDKACCQVLQFASLRYDRDFARVAGREVRVRPLPYVVPSPGSLRVTGVDHRDLDAPDRLDEYDASRVIEELLLPPRGRSRLFLTFNGIAYDDEVLRRMLYRNLRSPWFHSQRGVRIDVLVLVRMIRLALGADKAIAFPAADADGKARTTLSETCAANGIEPTNAHDALADAEMTMRLADLVRRKAPWAWDLAYACGNAANIASHFAGSGTRRGCSTRGRNPACPRPATTCGSACGTRSCSWPTSRSSARDPSRGRCPRSAPSPARTRSRSSTST